MKPLACPFCGGDAVGRADGTCAARPFIVRCSREQCPGFNLSQGYAVSEQALLEWNRRVQLPPARSDPVGDLFGFTKKSLVRGEMIILSLDRTGVLTSDQIAFSPNSEPLIRKPRQ